MNQGYLGNDNSNFLIEFLESACMCYYKSVWKIKLKVHTCVKSRSTWFVNTAGLVTIKFNDCSYQLQIETVFIFDLTEKKKIWVEHWWSGSTAISFRNHKESHKCPQRSDFKSN